jgi:hypothetical protein
MIEKCSIGNMNNNLQNITLIILILILIIVILFYIRNSSLKHDELVEKYTTISTNVINRTPDISHSGSLTNTNGLSQFPTSGTDVTLRPCQVKFNNDGSSKYEYQDNWQEIGMLDGGEVPVKIIGRDNTTNANTFTNFSEKSRCFKELSSTDTYKYKYLNNDLIQYDKNNFVSLTSNINGVPVAKNYMEMKFDIFGSNINHFDNIRNSICSLNYSKTLRSEDSSSSSTLGNTELYRLKLNTDNIIETIEKITIDPTDNHVFNKNTSFSVDNLIGANTGIYKYDTAINKFIFEPRNASVSNDIRTINLYQFERNLFCDKQEIKSYKKLDNAKIDMIKIINYNVPKPTPIDGTEIPARYITGSTYSTYISNIKKENSLGGLAGVNGYLDALIKSELDTLNAHTSNILKEKRDANQILVNARARFIEPSNNSKGKFIQNAIIKNNYDDDEKKYKLLLSEKYYDLGFGDVTYSSYTINEGHSSIIVLSRDEPILQEFVSETGTGTQDVYEIKVYKENDTHTFPVNTTCDILIVGGGGGGGHGGDNGRGGGGGGAGQFLLKTNYSLNAGTYKINVGRGGVGGNITTQYGETGNNSSISTASNTILLESSGGGGGARGLSGNVSNGLNGASGGGGCGDGGANTGLGGTASIQFVNNNTLYTGYNGASGGPAYNGGGGGGYTSAGFSATTTSGGDGGSGITNNITGVVMNYCAGGGGGAYNNGVSTGTRGGNGGNITAGNGGKWPGANGGNATYGSGSGGGGGGPSDPGGGTFLGGDGGSGIVIIKYKKIAEPIDNNVRKKITLEYKEKSYIREFRHSGGTENQTEYKGNDGLVLTAKATADILIVGGGGGGGKFGGGGGGGAILFGSNITLNAGSISIKVGNGGAGAIQQDSGAGINGVNGGASSIILGSIEHIANAGGGGGSRGQPSFNFPGANGNIGGSGGGGASGESGTHLGGASNINTYSNFQSFGNSGGNGKRGGEPYYASGGGGGAGSVGGNHTTNTGGVGGSGKEFISYFGTSVGHNGWFSGGGGGSSFTFNNNALVGFGNGGSGLFGGGGNSGINRSPSPNISATSGLPDTGGGGGGSAYDDIGGNGGSGIVIVKYRYTSDQRYRLHFPRKTKVQFILNGDMNGGNSIQLNDDLEGTFIITITSTKMFIEKEGGGLNNKKEYLSNKIDIIYELFDTLDNINNTFTDTLTTTNSIKTNVYNNTLFSINNCFLFQPNKYNKYKISGFIPKANKKGDNDIDFNIVLIIRDPKDSTRLIDMSKDLYSIRYEFQSFVSANEITPIDIYITIKPLPDVNKDTIYYSYFAFKTYFRSSGSGLNSSEIQVFLSNRTYTTSITSFNKISDWITDLSNKNIWGLSTMDTEISDIIRNLLSVDNIDNKCNATSDSRICDIRKLIYIKNKINGTSVSSTGSPSLIQNVSIVSQNVFPRNSPYVNFNIDDYISYESSTLIAPQQRTTTFDIKSTATKYMYFYMGQVS